MEGGVLRDVLMGRKRDEGGERYTFLPMKAIQAIRGEVMAECYVWRRA